MLNICFLWHHHQPPYKNYLTNTSLLPWVYLHSLRGYLWTARILKNFSKIKVTFNLVPSLIEQILNYGSGDFNDIYFQHFLKNPKEMDEAEIKFILENFFNFNHFNMGKNLNYLQKLLNKKNSGAEVNDFSQQEIFDLQILFHLAWIDEREKKENIVLNELVKKQKNYNQNDKNALKKEIISIIKKIIPLYKELQNEGKIEICTSPYFHPILPLLCNAQKNAVELCPQNLQFIYPQDADLQTNIGAELYKQVFNKYPLGMWLPEGSISNEALDILIKNNISWVATDEVILQKSLNLNLQSEDRKYLYQPYIYKNGNKQIFIFFRDHIISDLFGFVYYKIDKKSAEKDFFVRLENIAKQSKENSTLSIILDGENPWENYVDAEDFLSNIYEKLEKKDYINCTTFSNVLKNCNETIQDIRSIQPGSWIDGTFSTWIGDKEKNILWQYLKSAREKLNEKLLTKEIFFSNSKESIILKSLLAAEASDWFWWMGENYSKEMVERFFLLFKTHLKNFYSLQSLNIPVYLEKELRQKSQSIKVLKRIKPQIDGQDTSFYEWLGAICWENTISTMQKSNYLVKKIFMGFDEDNLYFKIEFNSSALKKNQNLTVEIYLIKTIADSENKSLKLRINFNEEQPGVKFYFKQNLEVAVSKETYIFKPGEEIAYFINILNENNYEIERFPENNFYNFLVPTKEEEESDWIV